MLIPNWANSTGGSPYSFSKAHLAPLLSENHHSASRTLTTNQPWVTGASPDPKSSSCASGTDTIRLVAIFVVLRCLLDRQEPALAPLHPDLGFRLQFEGRLIQSSEPNLDERVTGPDWIKQSRPAERAEATSVIARDLTTHLERLDRPLPIHSERAPRLLSAIRAVATPDVYRVTAHAVADRPAEASAGAYSRPHASMVRNTAVGQRAGMSRERGQALSGYSTRWAKTQTWPSGSVAVKRRSPTGAVSSSVTSAPAAFALS